MRAELCAELEKYRECDPEVMQQMKNETVVAKEAANRWTGAFLVKCDPHLNQKHR